MKKKYLRTLIIILILAALPVGFYILDKKIGEKRFMASDTELAQGAHPDYDLSESNPEEFIKAFKYQMLKKAVVDQTSVGPGITLGLFLMKDEDGQTVNVCEKYRTIDYIFTAEGVAFSGDLPTLIVRGPCIVESDGRTIEGLPLPLSKIVKSPVGTTQFVGEIPGRTETTKIFAKNGMNIWPTEWSWTGVTLYANPDEPTLSFNGYEVISVLGAPVIVKTNE